MPSLDKRNTTMRMKHMVLTTLGCLLLSITTAAVAADQQEQSLKVGENGEITLTRPTKVVNILLLPDTYVVEHRVSGENHFIRFVELKQVASSEGKRTITYTEQNNAGEMKCLMQPLDAPATETSVTILAEDGGDRITQVTIKGEDVVHTFGHVSQ